MSVHVTEWWSKVLGLSPTIQTKISLFKNDFKMPGFIFTKLFSFVT